MQQGTNKRISLKGGPHGLHQYEEASERDTTKDAHLRRSKVCFQGRQDRVRPRLSLLREHRTNEDTKAGRVGGRVAAGQVESV